MAEEPRTLIERLVGQPAPEASLPWTTDANSQDELGPAAKASLADLAAISTLVVYFFPAPAEEDREADTMSRAFQDCCEEVEQLGTRIIGVSTQSAREQQQMAGPPELIAHLLLADAELELADELGVPTTETDGRDEYEPMTLVIHDGRIAHVVYPIVLPRAHIDGVLSWLAQHDQRQAGPRSQRDLAVQAQAYLEEVRDGTGWTVSLAALDGAEVVCVSCLRSRHDGPSVLQGADVRLPAYCAALGKVLLAHLPDDQLEQLLAVMKLERRTEATFTDLAAFRAELAVIHEAGWAMSEGEFMLGLHGLAVPIRGTSANAVAALGVSALGDGLLEGQPIEELRPLKEAGAALSERLGFQLAEEGESD